MRRTFVLLGVCKASGTDRDGTLTLTGGGRWRRTRVASPLSWGLEAGTDTEYRGLDYGACVSSSSHARCAIRILSAFSNRYDDEASANR